MKIETTALILLLFIYLTVSLGVEDDDIIAGQSSDYLPRASPHLSHDLNDFDIFNESDSTSLNSLKIQSKCDLCCSSSEIIEKCQKMATRSGVDEKRRSNVCTDVTSIFAILSCKEECTHVNSPQCKSLSKFSLLKGYASRIFAAIRELTNKTDSEQYNNALIKVKVETCCAALGKMMQSIDKADSCLNEQSNIHPNFFNCLRSKIDDEITATSDKSVKSILNFTKAVLAIVEETVCKDIEKCQIQ